MFMGTHVHMYMKTHTAHTEIYVYTSIYIEASGCVYTVPDHFLIRYKSVTDQPSFALDKVIRYNFVPAIRYSFVPARKEEQLCTCTALKLYWYSVNAREKEHFCVGYKWPGTVQPQLKQNAIPILIGSHE